MRLLRLFLVVDNCLLFGQRSNGDFVASLVNICSN
eukprot:UN12643